MARLVHPILSDDLRTRLERIGDALWAGLLRPLPHAEIEAAAARLAAMPAAAVPMAGGMVAQALAVPYGESPPIRSAILARLLGRPHDAAIPAATPALQTLLLFHPDGRRREAALHGLDTLADSPFLVTAIFYRLNDWAGPVRAAAPCAFCPRPIPPRSRRRWRSCCCACRAGGAGRTTGPCSTPSWRWSRSWPPSRKACARRVTARWRVCCATLSPSRGSIRICSTSPTTRAFRRCAWWLCAR